MSRTIFGACAGFLRVKLVKEAKYLGGMSFEVDTVETVSIVVRNEGAVLAQMVVQICRKLSLPAAVLKKAYPGPEDLLLVTGRHELFIGKPPVSCRPDSPLDYLSYCKSSCNGAGLETEGGMSDTISRRGLIRRAI